MFVVVISDGWEFIVLFVCFFVSGVRFRYSLHWSDKLDNHS